MPGNIMPHPLFGTYILARAGQVAGKTAARVDPDRVSLPVPRFHQERSLSCEMASLRMAAHYHKAIHTETDLVQLMPTDRTQPRLVGAKTVWGDPNKVFPGNIRGWQLYVGGLRHYPTRAKRGGWGYGVYAPVIAEVATKIGLQAEVFDEVDYVYSSLDRGHVPIVIVPCSGRSSSRKWSWVTPEGISVPAIDGEHAIAVRGYDEVRVLVNDPLGRIASYNRVVFERAFGLLAMGVAIGPAVPVIPVPEPAPPPPDNPAPEPAPPSTGPRRKHWPCPRRR